MVSIAETLATMIRDTVRGVNTTLIGTVVSVRDTGRVDVEVKHLVNNLPLRLYNLPVLNPSYNHVMIRATPAVGDVVVLLIAKYDLTTQLEEAGMLTHNIQKSSAFQPGHAMVIGTLHTLDDDQTTPPVSGAVEITHPSGAGIVISSDGDVTITGKTITFKQVTV